MVIITYFYEDASLDALKGLVYSDDSEVSDLLCRKRDLNGDLRIQNPSCFQPARDAKPRQVVLPRRASG